jgi:hypothetical protein
MSNKPIKGQGNKYPPATIEEGLYALARFNGNSRRAHKALAEVGIEVPRGTLEHWKQRTHKERYARIRDEVIPSVYQEHADRFHELVELESNIAQELAEQLRDKVHELEARDLSTALRNLEVSKSLNFDKASIADGRPTVIHEKRDLSEIVRALQGKGIEIEVIEDANPRPLESGEDQE